MVGFFVNYHRGDQKMKKLLSLAVGLLMCVNQAWAIDSPENIPIPVLGADLNLEIPILYYQPPLGAPMWLEVNLGYTPGPNGEIMFFVSDYKIVDPDKLLKGFTQTPNTDGNNTDGNNTDGNNTEGNNTDNNSNSGEPAAYKGIVAAHNVWRKKVGVPNLKWSDKLAGVAQNWANKLKRNGKDGECAFEHSTNDYGENLYWTSGKVTDVKRVVDAWGNEVNDYNYSKNTCKQGKMCGHYTQIVWKDTKEVGCGKASCKVGGEVWVCSYDPPGNYKGEKPY